MICEDMNTGKQGGITLYTTYGEWFVKDTPTDPTGTKLVNGPLDGVDINDLEDGTIVYVGSAEDAASYESVPTETIEEDTSAPVTGDVDLEKFPEFEGIKYFTPQEFFCHCSNPNCEYKGSIHMHHELLVILDRCRERFGKPITVTSGLRDKNYNASVGGVSGSRHTDGRAADIVVNGVSAYTVSAWAKTQPDVRYTYDITATASHIDVN